MDIGKELQDARIAKNITLETVARETNIRKVYLEAIEKNDFASLSGAVIVKGIIRTYGNYLGLAGTQLVEAYKADTTGAGSVQNNNTIRESRHVKVRPSFKSNRDIGSGNGNEHRWLFVVAGILVLLLVAGGGVYYLTRSDRAADFSLPFQFGIFSETERKN